MGVWASCGFVFEFGSIGSVGWAEERGSFSGVWARQHLDGQ